MAPTVLIVVGMAGSGKSTFMQRLSSHLSQNQKEVFSINLDPAVLTTSFPVSIDIRETISYKDVMKEYKLGPNGAIGTCLNLFSTKFHQVCDAIQQETSTDYVLLDTPGQIEIFTWSAAGTIITESLAGSFPTVLIYLVDTERCLSPSTFMSNMLHACSILYKTKLPFILVFNKIDVQPHDFAVKWMTDFECLQSVLASDTSFMSSLINSQSLLLEEFYSQLNVVGVSSLMGLGMEDFMEAVKNGEEEYEKEYLPELKALIEARELKTKSTKSKELEKIMAELKLTKGGKIVLDV